MSRFAMKMMISGYNKRERRDTLIAGLRGFEKLEKLEREGKRSLNRSRRENYEARLLKKHGAVKNWYKGSSKSTEGGERRKEGKRQTQREKKVETERLVETVMFVPATPDGELARDIQEADDRIRESTGERRMKVVERGGSRSERSSVGTTLGGAESVRGHTA